MARLRRGSAFAVYLSGPRDRRRSCAVQVFLPWAKILAEAEFTSAEHFNFSRNPKKEGHDGCRVLLFWSGQRGSNSLPGIPRMAGRHSQAPCLTSDPIAPSARGGGSEFAPIISGPKGRRRSCAVQVFLPWAKILAEAEFTSAEHFNFSRNPKKEGHDGCRVLLFWSGQRGSNSLPGIPRMAGRHSQAPCLTSDPIAPSARGGGSEFASCAKNRTSEIGCPVSLWSGQRGSNSLPPPWQGGALPDELCPRNKGYSTRETPACQDSSVRFSVFSSAESPASPPITNSISPTGPCAG